MSLYGAYKIKILNSYNLFEIFILGIISGMQLSIIVTVIITWLKESNVPLEIVTTFVSAKIAYSLKFLLAPFTDYFKLPFLIRFGKRKSWMLLCSGINIIILLLISTINPATNLSLIYFFAFAFGLCSAIFDINIAAFRIDQIETKLLGIASANASSGFNIGMLLITTGSFYYVDITKNWNNAFLLIAILFVIAILFITTIKESIVVINNSVSSIKTIVTYDFIVNPIKEFLTRDYSRLILLAIILFKISDALLTIIYNPFYLDCGYSKTQIATITSFYGFPVVIFGAYVSAFITYNFGNIRTLILAGFIQIIAKLSFLWLAYQSISIENLIVTVMFENFAAGIGSTALISYLSLLCNKQYSATQYAILSSMSSLCSTTIAMFSGTMIKILDWNMYFIVGSLISIPSILIFICLYEKNKAIKKGDKL